MKDQALFDRLKASSKVDENGCWIWQRSFRTDGYGQINLKNRPVGAHRAMWYALTGNLLKRSDNQLVCHSCDIRSCINPAHLWIGTAKQNNDDRDMKGRNPHSTKTFCQRGHEFSAENTIITRGNTRVCKACVRASEARYRERVRIKKGTIRRPPVISDHARATVIELHNSGASYAQIIEVAKVSRAQISRVVKRFGRRSP